MTESEGNVNDEVNSYYVEQMPKLKCYIDDLVENKPYLLNPKLQEHLLRFLYRMYILNGKKFHSGVIPYEPYLDFSEYFLYEEDNQGPYPGDLDFCGFMKHVEQYFEANNPYIAVAFDETDDNIKKIKKEIWKRQYKHLPYVEYSE